MSLSWVPVVSQLISQRDQTLILAQPVQPLNSHSAHHSATARCRERANLKLYRAASRKDAAGPHGVHSSPAKKWCVPGNNPIWDILAQRKHLQPNYTPQKINELSFWEKTARLFIICTTIIKLVLISVVECCWISQLASSGGLSEDHFTHKNTQ